MRHFELTIGVYLPDHADLPETFEDWLRRAFGNEAVEEMGALATNLKAVVETRYPLAEDVVNRRRQANILRSGPRYA